MPVNSAILEVETGGLQFDGTKVSETPSQKQAGHGGVHICNPAMLEGSWLEVEGSQFEASSGKNMGPYLKAKGLGVWLKW
jgi:hypothetical protein